MWNPTTFNVNTTQGITWLNRMFYQQVVSPTKGAYLQQAGESEQEYEKQKAEIQNKDDDDDDKDITIEI